MLAVHRHGPGAESLVDRKMGDRNMERRDPVFYIAVHHLPVRIFVQRPERKIDAGLRDHRRRTGLRFFGRFGNGG